MKEQKLISERDTLVTTGKLSTLLVEIFIIFLHPNPLTHGKKKKEKSELDNISIFLYKFFMLGISFTMDTAQAVVYDINDFLGIFILLRVYLIVRVLLNSTIYASTRAFRICRM